jgi:LmbE family N-acetylglucosaminyl deacetylase
VKVLAVGAHPDDLEIMCAGTLARYQRSGHDVVMAHLCNGDKGSFTDEPEHVATVREQEARAAAAVLGARHINAGIPDGEVLGADRAHRDIVVDIIRDVRPDLILTHWPDDYMCDHNETSKLVFDASFLATEAARRTAFANYETVTPIYYFEPVAGLRFVPTEYVDISDCLEQKLAAFDCHRSQADFLDDVGHAAPMREQIEIAARYRGMQSGVRYAEGFRPCQVALRGTTRRLLP